MLDDPIVKEVRKAREEILASFNNDLKAMWEDARRAQYSSGHRVVSFNKKRLLVVKEPQPPYGSADKK